MKEMTKPKVGEIFALKPANTGKNIPIIRYKEVIIRVSTKETEVKPMIKTINSCNEILILSPRGKENMPTTHSMANITAFLTIL